MADPGGGVSPGCLWERCHCLYQLDLSICPRLQQLHRGLLYFRDTRGRTRDIGPWPDVL